MVETGNGETPAVRQKDVEQWILYVDDASNKNGSRAGMMLISPEGHKIHCYTFWVLCAEQRGRIRGTNSSFELSKRAASP